MELQTELITVATGDGPMPAFRARPAVVGEPLPAIVVILEAWGVDDHIRDIARRAATAGYVALAPDLYAIGSERPEVLRPERVEDVKAFINTMPPAAWGDPEALQRALDALPEPKRTEVAESRTAVFSRAAQLDRFVPALAATRRAPGGGSARSGSAWAGVSRAGSPVPMPASRLPPSSTGRPPTRSP
jgi:dienelactone hydrolase